MTDDQLMKGFELSKKIGRLSAALDSLEHQETPHPFFCPEVTESAWKAARQLFKTDIQKQIEATKTEYEAL